MHLLTSTVSKTSSVYRDAAFPIAMLYNLSLSVWLNGLIISHRRFITPCQRYCDTSSFFFWSSISNNNNSAHVCLAEIGLIIDIIPKRWLEASAWMVCSRVWSVGVLKKDFSVHLILNHPFWKSEYTYRCVSGSFVNES